MERREIPEWLMSMINAEFNTTQKQHEDEKAYFCVICGGNSISKKEKEEEHEGHIVLQAYNISRKYGYKDEDVSKLGPNILDLSGIRPFSVNKSFVFFPKSRGPKPKNKGRPDYCLECGYGLRLGLGRGKSEYSFCSILCKVSYGKFETVEMIVKHEDLSQNLVNKESTGEGNLVISEDIVVENQGFRKRRRKGVHRVPQRAPFF
ncbi:hypothetical protein vseg_018343 [Gypsophila vaccaria]